MNKRTLEAIPPNKYDKYSVWISWIYYVFVLISLYVFFAFLPKFAIFNGRMEFNMFSIIRCRAKDMRIRVVFFIFITTLLFSCSNRDLILKLDMAESILETHPDSALAIIRSIDTLSLRSEATKARYCLLNAIALDKNYIDTSNLLIIQPAVDYYGKHGPADERLKAYYQQGVILSNGGDLNNAAISYSLAENDISAAKDGKYKGLLSTAFADLYGRVYNFEKKLEYTEKAIVYYLAVRDSIGYHLALGEMATVYQSQQDWHKADSLYRISLYKASGDSLAMPLLLSNYARMKMLMPSEDPLGAISLLESKFRNYNSPPTLKDYCVYALASEMNGDHSTCDRVLKMFDSLDEYRREETTYWEYRIASLRGDYPKAIMLLKKSYAGQDALVSDLVSNSIEETLKEYYASSINQYRQRAKVRLLTLALFATSIVILLFLILVIAGNKRRKEREKYEQMLRISYNTNLMLKQANASLEEKQGDYQAECQALIEKTDILEDNLSRLRKTFANMYKERFTVLGELCNAYLTTQERTDKHELIYHSVQNQIAFFIGDEKLQSRLESQINRDLNNIIRHLRSDLPDLSPKDVRFLCYCIIGLDPGIIGTLLDMNLSNVYTRKSRFKDKIRAIESPYKDDYLRML